MIHCTGFQYSFLPQSENNTMLWVANTMSQLYLKLPNPRKRDLMYPVLIGLLCVFCLLKSQGMPFLTKGPLSRKLWHIEQIILCLLCIPRKRPHRLRTHLAHPLNSLPAQIQCLWFQASNLFLQDFARKELISWTAFAFS